VERVVANRASSLRRGIEILVALGGDVAVAGGGLGVTQVAAITGHEKSQVSRALGVLAQSGLVERDPDTRRYRLGWRLFTLATNAGEPALLDAAHGALDQLVAELGETVHLSVLRDGAVHTLLSRSPPSSVAASGWTGRTVPVTCTSSGRALLFDHDRAALETLLAGADFGQTGPNGVRSLDELQARIGIARAAGCAVVDEEFEAGLVGVAAPIRDFTGRIVAALNVSAPKFRLGNRLDEAARAVKRVADGLSEGLRGREPQAQLRAVHNEESA
jgi:DNA-binding IclR family transcriptional regulator